MAKKTTKKRAKKSKPMSAAKFQKALVALGSETFDQGALLLGVGRRSFVRYHTGSAPVPLVVERLLAMYQKHGVPKELA